MKASIDLPDDLLRTMKMQAVQEGRKLKDVAAGIIRRGLAQPPAPATRKGIRERVQLPLIQCAPDAPASRMTARELIALEHASQTQEDLERLGLAL